VIVCIVARRIWTHGLGGLEEHSRNAAMELVRQGHTVHVLTTAHPDGRAEETAYGASLHYLRATPPGDYSRAWWRESRRWADAHFARLGIEAVLSMSAAAGGLVGLPGPPIFTVIVGWGWNQLRSFWHDSPGWRRLVDVPRSALWLAAVLQRSRALLRASARVLAVSAEIERQLRGYRVCRLPNFIETAQFAEDPTARQRDIADKVGVTERAVSGIIADLEASGYVRRERVGRRNRYRVMRRGRLRHPIEAHRSVGQLLDAVMMTS